MRLYHRTDRAPAILSEGFRDGEGSYGLATMTLRGVFVSDEPLSINEGAKGSELLQITLPDEVDLGDYELVEEFGTYREWCVPAALLNELGTVQPAGIEDDPWA